VVLTGRKDAINRIIERVLAGESISGTQGQGAHGQNELMLDAMERRVSQTRPVNTTPYSSSNCFLTPFFVNVSRSAPAQIRLMLPSSCASGMPCAPSPSGALSTDTSGKKLDWGRD
jgi:hypothetical protein